MKSNPILALADSLAKKQPAVLAMVIHTQGASPAKVGAQLVYLADAWPVIQQGGARTKNYRLSEAGEEAIGTLCGGEVDVFLQP
ncbi:MAG: hypothetical protein EHM35_16765 [Planctomycetaceae bacterium]|nr:MAG: hypothetical protein EHM35_16765 [Planctomycetaceae bacterium]